MDPADWNALAQLPALLFLLATAAGLAGMAASAAAARGYAAGAAVPVVDAAEVFLQPVLLPAPVRPCC